MLAIVRLAVGRRWAGGGLAAGARLMRGRRRSVDTGRFNLAQSIGAMGSLLPNPAVLVHSPTGRVRVVSMDDADRIREAIQEVLQDDGDRYNQVMIGDLVVIAECTSIEGDTQLFMLHNTDIPRWKELGFLHDRLVSISEGHFVLGGDDD